MERIEKTVFLSYRRTNITWALAIFQNLTQNGFDVFFDFNGIASGDFERIILGNITARAHFIVLLTPSALERCNDPVDWLRREIETALANQRNIVPLMLEGFDFGTPKIASQLTGKLAALKRYNGLSVPPEYFPEAMEKLRSKYLNVPLASVLHPASPFAQRAAAEQKHAAGAAPAVHEGELTAQQWFERGVAAVDIDERLRFYNEAIRLKPDFAAAFNNRGLARRAKGDIEGALQVLMRSTPSPRNCSVRTNPDLFHFPLGNFLTSPVIIVSSVSANRLRANNQSPKSHSKANSKPSNPPRRMLSRRSLHQTQPRASAF
jgi:hypothetical protein